jgi:hypothetical protein
MHPFECLKEATSLSFLMFCQLQTCYLVIVLTQLLLEQQYASIVWKALKVPNQKSVSEGHVGEEGSAVHY